MQSNRLYSEVPNKRWGLNKQGVKKDSEIRLTGLGQNKRGRWEGRNLRNG